MKTPNPKNSLHHTRFVTVGDCMQSNVVKMFRQRLVSAGFTNISIYDCGYGSYSVNCISPDGVFIRRRLTEIQMCAIPRLVWFD